MANCTFMCNPIYPRAYFNMLLHIIISNFGDDTVTGFKLVVSDPESGRTYQKEFGVDVLGKLRVKKIGEEVDGGLVGLPGYTLEITGGSDASGFPMRRGIHGSQRPKALLSGGVGYKPKEDVRRRKRVRGECVDDDIVQLNTKVTKTGQRPLAELLGVEAKEGGGEAPAEEAKEAEEKPKEPAEKPKETKEKPKESKGEPSEGEDKPEKPEEKKESEAKKKEEPKAAEETKE